MRENESVCGLLVKCCDWAVGHTPAHMIVLVVACHCLCLCIGFFDDDDEPHCNCNCSRCETEQSEVNRHTCAIEI